MGLSVKGYGIHGTNEPKSIGKAASHGCIRLRNKDVEELFGLVRVGDEVELLGQADANLIALFGPVPAADPQKTPKQLGPATPPTKPAPALVLATGMAAR